MMTLNKEERNRARKQTEAITNAHNLRYLHVRKHTIFDDGVGESAVLSNKGGVTIAYARRRPDDNVILVSTALVHDNDSYCKAHGRAIAARRFADAHCIALRVPKNMSTSFFLKSVFSGMVQYG
jgi:hypothetical protein